MQLDSDCGEGCGTTVTGGITLTCDPLGRLYETVGAATTRLGYDGGNVIAEYNGSNVLQRRYVFGPGTDEPLVWYEGTGTSTRIFYHADERGSVIALSNGSGALTDINRYDEYGIPGSNAGRFQYTGQQWLSDLGMYHYRARAYSPTLGRFMQTDPIGFDGGMNIYAYVQDDPVNWTDPSGLVQVCHYEEDSSGGRVRGRRVCTDEIDENHDGRIDQTDADIRAVREATAENNRLVQNNHNSATEAELRRNQQAYADFINSAQGALLFDRLAETHNLYMNRYFGVGLAVVFGWGTGGMGIVIIYAGLGTAGVEIITGATNVPTRPDRRGH